MVGIFAKGSTGMSLIDTRRRAESLGVELVVASLNYRTYSNSETINAMIKANLTQHVEVIKNLSSIDKLRIILKLNLEQNSLGSNINTNIDVQSEVSRDIHSDSGDIDNLHCSNLDEPIRQNENEKTLRSIDTTPTQSQVWFYNGRGHSNSTVVYKDDPDGNRSMNLYYNKLS